MQPTSGYSSGARKQAAHILSQPPFTAKPGYAPLRGVFHAIGHALSDVFGPIVRFIERAILHPIFHPFQVWFGSGPGLVLVIVVGVAVGVGVAVLLVRRRSRIGPVTDTEAPVAPRSETADALEAQAAAAELAGDKELAVRLRFRAGMSRLATVGAIPDRDITTTQQTRRSLRSRRFDGLADRHEAIAYANDAASDDDAAAAREEWPQVVKEAEAIVRAHSELASAAAGSGGASGSDARTDNSPPGPAT